LGVRMQGIPVARQHGKKGQVGFRDGAAAAFEYLAYLEIFEIVCGHAVSSILCIAISRSLARCILAPLELCVVGNSLTAQIRAGTLKAASVRRTPAFTAASSKLASGRKMTKAAQRTCPLISTPTTWALSTSACSFKTSSTSTGLTR